jgi:hypothetical protein
MNDQFEKVSLCELLDRCITTPGYGDNVLTIDWSDEPQGKEFYECCKLKTGVTERTLREHCQWLAEISNIVPLDIEKSRIASKYSEFHSSFIVQSHRTGSKKPLANCIMQLLRRNLIDTFSVIFTILVPEDSSDHELTHKEIANIHQVIRGGTKGENFYIMGISKGRTNRIKSGVMLVMTQFVYDRPPWCEEKMREIDL